MSVHNETLFPLDASTVGGGVTSHQAIVSLLSHAAAVDRGALPHAHSTTPFTTNSACAAGSGPVTTARDVRACARPPPPSPQSSHLHHQTSLARSLLASYSPCMRVRLALVSFEVAVHASHFYWHFCPK